MAVVDGSLQGRRYVTVTLTIIVTLITRKNRQSYRHADPRQQQQHTAMAVAARVTSNRATVTVLITV